MRHEDLTRSLIQLSTELTDCKVEIAVSKAITQVIDQIVALRQEVHHEISGLRHEMHDFKQEMGSRLSSVETALGLRKQSRAEMRNRFYDYSFKAGWVLLGSLLTYLAGHFHWFF